jgi:hypothetical protein
MKCHREVHVGNFRYAGLDLRCLRRLLKLDKQTGCEKLMNHIHSHTSLILREQAETSSLARERNGSVLSCKQNCKQEASVLCRKYITLQKIEM